MRLRYFRTLLYLKSFVYVHIFHMSKISESFCWNFSVRHFKQKFDQTWTFFKVFINKNFLGQTFFGTKIDDIQKVFSTHPNTKSVTKLPKGAYEWTMNTFVSGVEIITNRKNTDHGFPSFSKNI